MLPAPPTVVDADVLLRNVDFTWRNGLPGALLAMADSHYSLTTGVGLFAASEVLDEVERNLPRIASHRRAPDAQFRRVWDEQVGPKVRFVELDPESMLDPRIEGTDSKDRPTARLAALLAPCVIATDNRRHFRSFDLAKTKTDHVALDLRRIGGVTLGTKGALIPPGLILGLGGEAAKSLEARIGRGPTVSAFLLATLLVGLLVSSERARPLRAELADAYRKAAPLVAEQMLLASKAGERIEAFAIERGPDSSSPLAMLARRLATLQSVMTTEEISSSLIGAGVPFEGERHQKATRAWLVSNPCFEEISRGRWALGRHLIGEGVDG
jgi:hypothetical protein